MTPLEHQRAAAKIVGYGPIMLRREGDYAIVEIEFNGKWREVIREFVDSNFSHIVEPLGIQEAIFGHNRVDVAAEKGGTEK